MAGKLGCRAMPSRPRSEAEFTGRSSTVVPTTPLVTRFTRPDAFSLIRKSSGPMKAMQVGCVRPSTTVATWRVLSVSDGFVPCPRTSREMPQARPTSRQQAGDPTRRSDGPAPPPLKSPGVPLSGGPQVHSWVRSLIQ